MGLALSWLLLAGCIRSGSPFAGGSSISGGADGGDTGAVETSTTDGSTDAVEPTDGTGEDLGTADSGTADPGTDTGTGVAPPSGEAPAVVATWNLHNFSKYGENEFRIGDIATVIGDLGADVLAVQELKVKDNTQGDPPQAWDALLDALPDHDGVHAPWKTKDSTVGLIWDTSTTTLVDSKVIFETEWSAFPRAPLEADVVVEKAGGQSDFRVIVLHLKAFKGEEQVDRRREACEKLVAYISDPANERVIIIGDYNDDPYDEPDKNSYLGTFLENEPAFFFVTASLPLGTVTSTGYGTWVDGAWQDGEFLDHAVVTGALNSAFSMITPETQGKPVSGFSAWSKDYSDHFPLLIHFEP